MFFHVETIVYSVIVCIVELQYLETITFEQEEYNIIANKPLKLVCNIENSISATIRIRTPDNTLVVSCEPTITSPIVVPGSCSSSTGVYTGSINETANTVTVTTNTLPGDVNGTWLCTHGSSSAGIVFPNPIPCLVSENFDLNPSSLTGNITSDMAEISLSATYRCINVDVSFKWILKAGTNHEFISNLVSTNSSVCSDTGTCTGVNAYTQTISSNSIFQFATGQSLQGVYELSLEVHYANGMFALKSQSIGNFEFSVHTSTPTSTTKPPPDNTCVLGIQDIYCGLILGGVILAALTFLFVCYKRFCKNICKKLQSDNYKNHDTMNDGAAQVETTAEKMHESAERRGDNQSVVKASNEESKDSTAEGRVDQSRKSTDEVSQHEIVLIDVTNVGSKNGKKEESTNGKVDNASTDTPDYRKSRNSANDKIVNKTPESTAMDSPV